METRKRWAGRLRLSLRTDRARLPDRLRKIDCCRRKTTVTTEDKSVAKRHETSQEQDPEGSAKLPEKAQTLKEKLRKKKAAAPEGPTRR